MTAGPLASSPLSPTDARRVLLVLTWTRWLPVGFVVGIFILLQTGRGLSLPQVTTIVAVSSLTVFALELPTSGFTDAFGRRPVYLAAAVVNVAAAACYLLAHSFGAFVVAALLMGIFRALDSGPLEAWFVDTVHASEPGRDVDQDLAKVGGALGLAMSLGALASGALIWWHPVPGLPPLDHAVAVFLLLNVLHLLAVALLMKEPTSARAHGRARAEHLRASVHEVPRVIGSGLRLLRSSAVLGGLLVAEVGWSTGMISFESLMPLRLEEIVGSQTTAGALVGPLSALGWGVFGLGSYAAGRLSSRFGVARAAMLGRVLNGLAAVTVGLATGPIGLAAAYLFSMTTHGMNGAPHSALLHRVASAENRATVLSLNSMVAFLAAAAMYPLAGWFAERTSLAAACVAAGSLGAIGVLGYLPARRTERDRATARDG